MQMIHSSGYPAQISNVTATELLESVLELEALEQAPISSSVLKRLGHSLSYNTEERTLINGMVISLTSLIQQELNVSRFFVSGSYGRRVSLGRSFVDIIIFVKTPQNSSNRQSICSADPVVVNNEFLNYDKFIENVHQILKKAVGSLSKEWDMKPVCVHKHLPTRRRNKKNLAPPCVHLTAADNMVFTFYIAPGFALKADEQRQTTYPYVKAAYETGGLDSVVSWFPSLMECSTVDVATSHQNVHSFIRICSLWVQLISDVSVYRPYCFEILAFLTLRKMIVQSVSHQPGVQRHEFATFDFLEAFQTFLTWCTDLTQVVRLVEIYPLTTFISPWISYTKPLLTDQYNPYDNLLMHLSDADVARIQTAAHSALKKLEPLSTLETPADPAMVPPTVRDIFLQYKVSVFKQWLERVCFSLFTVFLVGCSAILVAFYLRSDFDLVLEDLFEKICDIAWVYTQQILSTMQPFLDMGLSFYRRHLTILQVSKSCDFIKQLLQQTFSKIVAHLQVSKLRISTCRCLPSFPKKNEQIDSPPHVFRDVCKKP